MKQAQTQRLGNKLRLYRWQGQQDSLTFMKSKETMDGAFERLCEAMWSLSPHETIEAAMG